MKEAASRVDTANQTTATTKEKLFLTNGETEGKNDNNDDEFNACDERDDEGVLKDCFDWNKNEHSNVSFNQSHPRINILQKNNAFFVDSK